MKIDYLLSLKKLALFAGMIASLSLLSGCGSKETNTGTDNPLNEGIESESNDDFINHRHLIITIGDQTIIFRECDEEVESIQFKDISHSYLDYLRYYQYEIRDNNGNVICSGKTNDDWTIEEINSEYEENMAQIIEEGSIENGAILYRGMENKSLQ